MDYGSSALTQHVQGALVVGDDDVRPLSLQMLPAAHVEAKAQEILHMTNQDADDPERKKRGGGDYSP